jgi:hypothetical protein
MNFSMSRTHCSSSRRWLASSAVPLPWHLSISVRTVPCCLYSSCRRSTCHKTTHNQNFFIWSQTAVSANCTLKWGHLWIRDTFYLSQWCPYFTGFTVCYNNHCYLDLEAWLVLGGVSVSVLRGSGGLAHISVWREDEGLEDGDAWVGGGSKPVTGDAPLRGAGFTRALVGEGGGQVAGFGEWGARENGDLAACGQRVGGHATDPALVVPQYQEHVRHPKLTYQHTYINQSQWVHLHGIPYIDSHLQIKVCTHRNTECWLYIFFCVAAAIRRCNSS